MFLKNKIFYFSCCSWIGHFLAFQLNHTLASLSQPFIYLDVSIQILYFLQSSPQSPLSLQGDFSDTVTLSYIKHFLQSSVNSILCVNHMHTHKYCSTFETQTRSLRASVYLVFTVVSPYHSCHIFSVQDNHGPTYKNFSLCQFCVSDSLAYSDCSFLSFLSVYVLCIL